MLCKGNIKDKDATALLRGLSTVAIGKAAGALGRAAAKISASAQCCASTYALSRVTRLFDLAVIETLRPTDKAASGRLRNARANVRFRKLLGAGEWRQAGVRDVPPSPSADRDKSRTWIT